MKLPHYIPENEIRLNLAELAIYNWLLDGTIGHMIQDQQSGSYFVRSSYIKFTIASLMERFGVGRSTVTKTLKSLEQ